MPALYSLHGDVRWANTDQEVADLGHYGWSTTPPAAPATAGVNWGAVQGLVNAGYRANPDGTITGPDGVVHAGSTGSDPMATVPKPPTQPSQLDADSAATASSVLRQYGLDDLLPYVDQIGRGLLTWAQLQNMLYDPSTAPGHLVDTLYPELQLLKKAGKTPMSIQQVLEYRTNASQMMRAAGMPEGFYDQPSDFTSWIVGGVGLPELQDRVKLYQQEALAAPQADRDALKALYHIDENGIAAYYMDASRALPLLQKQAEAASTYGGAVTAGYGPLSAAEAEQLAAAGVTGGSAVQSFGQLARSGSLFDPLLGSSEDQFSRAQQLALIQGDAAAATQLQQRAAQRVSDTQGGGSFATSQSGISGMGVAR